MLDKRDEVENLKRSLDLVMEGLKGDLLRARAVVRDAVGHLLAAFRGLEGAVGTQKELLKSVASTLNQSADQNGNGLTGTTSKLLQEFIEQVVRVSGTSMQIIEHLIVLSEHVELISKDSSAIDRLARESRFIAFNARIETQRAGEAGVTFKVVADEIKRLAGASASLSSHIRLEVDQSFVCLDLIRKSATDLASHDMNTAIESRTGLLDIVNRLDEVNVTLESMLARVTTLIADATRALQFEDMLTQLLDGTLKKIGTVTALTRRAFDALATGVNGSAAAELQTISRQLTELAEPGAVAQTSMNQGEIELF
jgi:methyl-accepting chemotaxis protein